MQQNEYPVHQTFTGRIPESEGGGWEFWCVDCSYRIRYTPNGAANGQFVHIMNGGDPTVRHTSSQISIERRSEVLDSSLPADSIDLLSEDGLYLDAGITEEAWLTPEISAFLKQLLARLD